jgi:hypothetical protein
VCSSDLTKTTFKRIALVAVAALGLGVLSVVPSNAAPSATTSGAYDNTNNTRSNMTKQKQTQTTHSKTK